MLVDAPAALFERLDTARLLAVADVHLAERAKRLQERPPTRRGVRVFVHAGDEALARGLVVQSYLDNGTTLYFDVPNRDTANDAAELQNLVLFSLRSDKTRAREKVAEALGWKLAQEWVTTDPKGKEFRDNLAALTLWLGEPEPDEDGSLRESVCLLFENGLVLTFTLNDLRVVGPVVASKFGDASASYTVPADEDDDAFDPAIS